MKRLITLILAFVFLLTLSLNAFAAKARMIDNADYLDEDEISAIEELLAEKRSEDDFDIVILTEHSVEDLESYADDYYDYNDYGIGDDRDGLLLLVTDFGCWLSTTGFGIEAVDPYLSELSSDFHENADISGYAYAFEEFIESVSVCVNFERDAIENGYYDDENIYDDYPIYNDDVIIDDFLEDNFETGYNSTGVEDILRFLLIPFIIGIIFAFIVTTVMKNKLRSVRRKSEAYDSIVPGSMKLGVSFDNFLSRSVTSTPRPKHDDNNSNMHSGSSGMSGGGTHVGSSGTTHGGGAF